MRTRTEKSIENRTTIHRVYILDSKYIYSMYIYFIFIICIYDIYILHDNKDRTQLLKGKIMKKDNMTPLQSIRHYCLVDCMRDQREEVKLCQSVDCPLYSMRLGKKGKGLSCLKTIRNKCLDCSGFQAKEVRNCEHVNCPIYVYRMGHNPNRRAIGGNGFEDTA